MTNTKKIKCKVIKVNKNKSVLVLVKNVKKHKIYKKFIKSYKKMNIHDEKNESKVNDIIYIKYYKPISKNKSWILDKIIN